MCVTVCVTVCATDCKEEREGGGGGGGTESGFLKESKERHHLGLPRPPAVAPEESVRLVQPISGGTWAHGLHSEPLQDEPLPRRADRALNTLTIDLQIHAGEDSYSSLQSGYFS